jgi:glutamate-1-semialdehyde 2,1-aminomutase
MLDSAHLHGIIPPMCTPLTVAGEVDVASTTRLVNYLIDGGVHGIFVLGSTGEGAALTGAQKRTVIETSAAAVKGRVPIFAGVIETSTPRCIEHGLDARDAGADALVLTSSFYYRPSQAEIVEHFRQVRQAVGLPLMAYDIPTVIQTKLELSTLHTLVRDHTIIGIKDSSGVFDLFRRLIVEMREANFRIFTGSELLLDLCLQMGAHGSVPGLANVFPAEYVELYNLARAGQWEQAGQLQERLMACFWELISQADSGSSFGASALGGFKTALKLKGVIATSVTLGPIRSFTTDEEGRVGSVLRRHGFVAEPSTAGPGARDDSGKASQIEERPRLSASRARLERSRRSLAGGVSSNVRLAAKPFPLFFQRASGATIWDVDGNQYTDYVLGQGPLILGHAHPRLTEAVSRAAMRGQVFAAQHDLEIEVAETLVRIVPGAELCRFGLSGSEMVQAALRLARAVTGRKRVVRFEGHYHGWFDNVLVGGQATNSTASGTADEAQWRQPTPGSAGQLESALSETANLPWNDLELLERYFQMAGPSIAAVILEPMMCNVGAILPQPGYLEGLRRLCDQYGALLIFDEVITGFRLGLQGAQGYFGVTADMAIFGKALGGGIPISALVGRRTHMERFTSDVNHSGTFNTNVMSMAAAAAVLTELERDQGAAYPHLNDTGRQLMIGIREIAERLSAPIIVQGPPTAFHVAFSRLPAITNQRDYLEHCDRETYSRLSVALLERGVRVLERGLWYISTAHTLDQVVDTLGAFEAALQEVLATNVVGERLAHHLA